MVDCSSMQAGGIEGGGFIPDNTIGETSLSDGRNDGYLLENESFEKYCR